MTFMTKEEFDQQENPRLVFVFPISAPRQTAIAVSVIAVIISFLALVLAVYCGYKVI